MRWYASPFAIRLRSLARRLGLTPIVSRVLARGAGYEAAFDEALLESVMPGDCCWDVGANVGHYTRKLSDRAGSKGVVVAFEPSPENNRQLELNTASHSNVVILPMALGSSDGVAEFKQGEDDSGSTTRALPENCPGDFQVRVTRGDHVIHANLAPPPNVLKIDTEGYELEVLQGMGSQLGNSTLRAVGVEVHFGLLAERGAEKSPAIIEKLLRQWGFSVRWTDASHIMAARNPI